MPRILLAALGAAFALQGFAADLLPWAQVREKVAAHWARTAPKEKLLSITKKGGPEYSASKRVTNSAYIGSSWYSAWITSYKTVQGSFARQVALVTVERPNSTRARFEVAALYRGEGERWIFDQIAVGPVTELGAPGDADLPDEGEAVAIFIGAWGRKRGDFEVQSIKVLAPPKLGASKQRRWLNYRLEIAARGTQKAAKKYRGRAVICKPADYSSVLRWDAAGKSWRADESMIQIVNEDRDCDLK